MEGVKVGMEEVVYEEEEEEEEGREEFGLSKGVTEEKEKLLFK